MICNKCKKPIVGCGCKKPKRHGCGCAERVLSIEVDPTNPAILAFNLDGKTVRYDFTSLVKFAETKTHLTADHENKELKYQGESGIETISAKDLGRLIHVADIGDVDASGIDEGAFLIYQKDSNCAEGCEGINNKWITWVEGEHRESFIQTLLGFDDTGHPVSLRPPTHTAQYYQLGWNGQNKLSYSQPIRVTTSTNTVAVRMDKTTKQLVYVEE